MRKVCSAAAGRLGAGMRGRCVVVSLVALTVCVGTASSQESLNAYYRFPVSVGGGYAPLSAVGEVTRRATVNEFAAEARMTLGSLPVLQPFALFGMETFDSDEADAPTVLGGVLAADATMPDYDERDVWDHRHFFGALGVGYAHRLSKEFELGADAFCGVSQSYFDRRVVTETGQWYTVGSLGLMAGASGKLTLNPSYNISIDLSPTMRYQRSFGALHDFDGIYFGVGFGASYRFGQDPDAPQAEVRALRFGALEMPPVFAAMQSVYVNKPITTVALTNVEKNEVTDLEVTFHQAGFMDSPTQCAQVDVLAPGESADVPIHASFNQEVFFTNGITPLNGEIAVSYTYRGRPVTQTQSVAYDLHDRNALTWNDDRKVCAFITPSDSAIGNYASFIRSASRDDNTDYLPDNLEYAMQAYHALAALGILYQPDPTAPFAQVQGDTMVVDSVSLPRETLKDITGDCDDITVLYSTLLEAVGVPTGIVTVPGHIYAAVNTGVTPREFARVHPDRSMTIDVDGSLWVLVEITLIGRGSFLDAWQTGMKEWTEYEDDVDNRAFYPTAEAQADYRPVGLRETDLGLQYGEAEEFLQPYRSDLTRLAGLIISPHRERAETRRSARSWNHLGVLAAKLKQYNTAENAFERAARSDPRDVGPALNLGSLHFLEGNYRRALSAFENAEDTLAAEVDGERSHAILTVYINLAKTHHALEHFDEAASYIARAEEIDAEAASRYQFIAAAGSTDGARASAAGDVPAILFLDEGEE